MCMWGTGNNKSQLPSAADTYRYDVQQDEVRPELLLSDLMMQNLHLYVAPEELAEFIRSNWHLVSVYAHRIHGS